ncbi:hypothetical protein Q7P37_005589 [Cladosporium fusiforme]
MTTPDTTSREGHAQAPRMQARRISRIGAMRGSLYKNVACGCVCSTLLGSNHPIQALAPRSTFFYTSTACGAPGESDLVIYSQHSPLIPFAIEYTITTTTTPTTTHPNSPPPALVTRHPPSFRPVPSVKALKPG